VKNNPSELIHTCTNCPYRIKIRKGARTYFKCEQLDRYMNFNTEIIDDCPLNKE